MELKQFTDNELKEIFDNGKSKLDIAKNLGINIIGINGSYLNKILEKYALLINYDLNNFTKLNIAYNKFLNKKPVCKQCGKLLTYVQYLLKLQFCCNSCSTIYNNIKRGERSDKTKEKISKSMKRYFDEHIISNETKLKISESVKATKSLHNCKNLKLNTDLINEGLIRNTNNIKYKEKYIDITKIILSKNM